jgi:hypothetical protein
VAVAVLGAPPKIASRFRFESFVASRSRSRCLLLLPPHPSAPPMASLFGARRRRSPGYDGEDDRSGGGRAKRRRLSPEEAAASLAEPGAATGTSHGWLSGFVSGAKRAISSVLLFSSPEETGSGEDGEVEEEEDDEYEEGIDLSNFSFLSLARALPL